MLVNHNKIVAYFKLMRFHKPVGIALLWLPTAWALWLANDGAPTIKLFLYLLCGTILMRTAGCVINDIADRHIDKHVLRTKTRPLTTGDISLLSAMVLLFVLLFAALLILIQLPKNCFYYALAALLITTIYPFCKRFIQAPQLVLGVAFSLGIPIAYVASWITPDLSMIILCMLNFAWIVSYDTMYAMVDKEDDLRIGVKSSAIWFAKQDCNVIFLLQLTCQILWICLARIHHYNIIFYILCLISTCIFAYQQYLIRSRIPINYFKAFTTNSTYGLVMWLGLIFAKF